MNNSQTEYIKTFLNKCKITISSFDDLNGMLIPREIFLDNELYNSVKEDISVLKQVFTSSSLTSLQSTAEDTQKWPLLNLVRQVLRSCNYKMTPKRVSAGYTKAGKKIYKRLFIVEKLTQIELSANTLPSATSVDTVLDTSSVTSVETIFTVASSVAPSEATVEGTSASITLSTPSSSL